MLVLVEVEVVHVLLDGDGLHEVLGVVGVLDAARHALLVLVGRHRWLGVGDCILVTLKQTLGVIYARH